MPYIITTTTPLPEYRPSDAVVIPDNSSRRAVATLDEARNAVLDVMWPHDYGKHERRFQVTAQIKHLPKQGGTVGPLPDGTVIEVEQLNEIACPGNPYHGPCGKPAHWRDAAGLTGLYPSGAFECSDTVCFTMTTLMDYNAAQGDKTR